MPGLKIEKHKIDRSIEPNSSVEEKTNFLNKDIRLFKTKFSDKQKEAFYIEFGILISAGVDIRAALELIEKEQKKAKIANIIKGIKDNVVKGASLSEAFKISGYFTSYEYFSIQIGEETGKIVKVLNQLVLFFTQKLKQRRQFISALSYPSIVLFTSIGAVSFMLYFIVPMFSDVFKRFEGELPYVTQIIINFSAFLTDYFYLLIIALFTIILAIWICSKKVWFQKYGSLLLINLPVIGSVFSGIYLARFCTSLSLLLGAKVPLLKAIRLIRQMISFYPIRHSLEQVEKDILNGKSLHQSLSEFKIYDSRLIALIKVGEEVNQLDVFFEKLAINYSEDVEHRTSLLNTFLEPIMIIFLGLVVGFILVAMYMPMFQLSTSIGV